MKMWKVKFCKPAAFRLKNLPFLVIACLIWALTGCVQEVEIELPDAPAKLVVVSFISPETEKVQVSVTKSRPLSSTGGFGSPSPVTDATVWLSDGNDSVQLPLDFNNSYSTFSYPILAGKTYYLRVTEPGGLAASASCTVPVKICQNLMARIDSSTFGAPSEEGNFIAETQWQDLAGEGDYYRTEILLILKDPAFPGTETPQVAAMADEPVAQDFQADGRSWKKQSFAIQNYRSLQQNKSLKYLHAFLYTSDRNYYEYHRSLFRFVNNPGDAFSDPVKIFTNIEGGLGVFGTYRSYEVKIPLR